MTWIATNKKTGVQCTYSDTEKSEMKSWFLNKFDWQQVEEQEKAPEPVAAKKVTNSNTDNGTEINGRGSGEARRT